jgi:hypothetical protein
MASSAGATDGGAALARSQARAILAERRFHSTPIPRPLHGVLHAVGKALEAPLHAVDEVVSKLGVHTPGGSTVVWAILAAFVLAISGALAARGSRRALSDPAALAARGGAAQPIHARDLEREAETAERAGRHADAVRLRFRAGLMRLAESERVQGAPSMLNAEISRALRSQRFDALARRFEEIAYGGRAAIEQDAETSRREWSRLLGSEERG